MNKAGKQTKIKEETKTEEQKEEEAAKRKAEEDKLLADLESWFGNLPKEVMISLKSDNEIESFIKLCMSKEMNVFFRNEIVLNILKNKALLEYLISEKGQELLSWLAPRIVEVEEIVRVEEAKTKKENPEKKQSLLSKAFKEFKKIKDRTEEKLMEKVVQVVPNSAKVNKVIQKSKKIENESKNESKNKDKNYEIQEEDAMAIIKFGELAKKDSVIAKKADDFLNQLVTGKGPLVTILKTEGIIDFIVKEALSNPKFIEGFLKGYSEIVIEKTTTEVTRVSVAQKK